MFKHDDLSEDSGDTGVVQIPVYVVAGDMNEESQCLPAMKPVGMALHVFNRSESLECVRWMIDDDCAFMSQNKCSIEDIEYVYEYVIRMLRASGVSLGIVLHAGIPPHYWLKFSNRNSFTRMEMENVMAEPGFVALLRDYDEWPETQ